MKVIFWEAAALSFYTYLSHPHILTIFTTIKHIKLKEADAWSLISLIASSNAKELSLSSEDAKVIKRFHKSTQATLFLVTHLWLASLKCGCAIGGMENIVKGRV